MKQLHSEDVIFRFRSYTRQGATSQILGENASSNLEAFEASKNALATDLSNVFAYLIV